MRITRRHLLALSAATAAAGVIGTGALVWHWWDQPASAPLSVLSAPEASFVRSLAAVAFPPTTVLPLDGADAQLDRFFDALLLHMPATPQHLLRVLLHALDHATVISHGATFSSLSFDERTATLEGWTHHDLAEIRNAGQSLVLLLGMGWSIHPSVAPHMRLLHSCGYGP